MPPEQEFLQAIHVAPEDAGLRRAYIDWLEEHADPRAEYLRLFCALEMESPNTPQAAALLAQMHAVQLRLCLRRCWVLQMCRGLMVGVLRDFQAGVSRQDWPQHEEYRRLARRLNALPVYADMGGGIILLRPDGELLLIDDDDDDAQPHPDQHWRQIALACAAEFFPELRPLLPPRPGDARRCLPCDGKGRWRWEVPEGKGLTPCGSCHGLGWIPLRPGHANDCPGCLGKGKKLLRLPHGTIDLPCGQCGGLGWMSDDPV